MTMTGTTAPAVAWSARRPADEDLPVVAGFFTEPDFYYRTALPDQLCEAEITRLLGDDTRLLLADGESVGLWAMRSVDYVSAHYELSLRLVASTPDEWWAAACREVITATRWRTEVVRLTMPAFEFDLRLPRILRGLGLTDEGLLSGVVTHRSGRYGNRYFSQLWAEESP
jgi:hypothetical protein